MVVPRSERHHAVGDRAELARKLLGPVLVQVTQVPLDQNRAKLDDEERRRDRPAGLILAAWTLTVRHTSPSIDTVTGLGKPPGSYGVIWRERRVGSEWTVSADKRHVHARGGQRRPGRMRAYMSGSRPRAWRTAAGALRRGYGDSSRPRAWRTAKRPGR